MRNTDAAIMAGYEVGLGRAEPTPALFKALEGNPALIDAYNRGIEKARAQMQTEALGPVEKIIKQRPMGIHVKNQAGE